MLRNAIKGSDQLFPLLGGRLSHLQTRLAAYRGGHRPLSFHFVEKVAERDISSFRDEADLVFRASKDKFNHVYRMAAIRIKIYLKPLSRFLV